MFWKLKNESIKVNPSGLRRSFKFGLSYSFVKKHFLQKKYFFGFIITIVNRIDR